MTKINAKLSRNYRFGTPEDVIEHVVAVLELADEILDEALHIESADDLDYKEVRATARICEDTALVLRKNKMVQELLGLL